MTLSPKAWKKAPPVPDSGEDSGDDIRRVPIGEFAAEFDSTPRTVRFYEELRLLTPRRKNGRRLYDKRDRVRMKLLLRGRRLGFSFGEIREVLDAYDAFRDGGATQARKLLGILQSKREHLDERAQEIDAMRAEIANTEKLCRATLARPAQKSARKNRSKKK